MASVGFLTLDIIPSVKNITSEIQSQVVNPANQGGVRAGEGISTNITKAASQGAANAGRVIQTEVAGAGAKAGADAGRAIQTEVATAGARAGREAGTGITSGVVQGSARAGTDAGRAITTGVAEGGVKGGKEAGTAITTGVAEGGVKGGREAGLGIQTGVVTGAKEGTAKAKEGMLSGFKGIAAGIGAVFAATKITDFFGDSLKSAKEYNATNRTVQATLKNVGQETGVTSKQFKELSERNADLSGKGDLAQLSMQKVLLGFTNIKNSGANKNFDDTTLAVNNLSAGMGVDLSAAANTLGKALNNPAKATASLRRAHIDLSQAQQDSIKEMTKAGDTAGAQRVILQAVEERYHGVAAASATAGAKNAVAMERVKTEVGQKLLPALAKWTSFMATEIIPRVAAIVGWLADHSKQVGIIVGVLASLFVGYKIWTAAQSLLNLVMNSSPFARIVLGIMALVAAFVYAYTHCETFRNIVNKVWDVLKDVGKFIADVFVAVWNWLLSVIRWVIDHWKALAVTLVILMPVVALIIGAITLLATHWRQVMHVLGEVFSWLWDTILKPIFGFIGDIFVWLYQNIVKPIIALLRGEIELWATVFTWLWDHIGPFFGLIGDIFTWLYQNIVKPIVAFIVGAIHVVGDIFTWLAETTAATFRLIGNVFMWLAENVVRPAVNVVAAIFTWLWSFLVGVFKVIEIVFAVFAAIVWVVLVAPIVWLVKNVLAPVFTWLWDSVIKPVFGFIGDIFSWLIDTVVKVVVGFIKAEITGLGIVFSWLWDNIVKPVFGFIGDAINWVWNEIIKPVFASIKFAIEILGGAVNWFYDHVIKPVWDAIGAAIQWVWEKVIKTAIAAIQAGIDGLGKGFQWLLDNVVRPVWDAIGAAIRFFWDKIVSPIFQWISDKAHDVGDAFKRFGETVGGIWEGLKHLVHDGIQGVINLVWNNGLRPVVNAVLKWVPGQSELPRFDVPSFAGGGVLPGYGPGSDTVAALLSPGEAVLVPELVRLLGPEVILAANAAAARGRSSGFSEGGLVPHFANGGIAGISPSTGGVAAAANAVPMPTPADLKAIETAATAATDALLALAASVSTILIPAQLSMSSTVNAVVVPTLRLAILHTGTLLPQANDVLVASTLVSWTRITATIVNAENTLTARQTDFQNFLSASWVAIANSVDQSVGRQNAAFGSLQGGLAAVRDAVGFTATWVRDRFAEMQGHAGSPVHWILQFPFNAGLIAAWNKLDADFALNKHIGDVRIPFAAGGRVFGPGSGTSDSVPAWLSNGEYVIPEAVASKTMPFLNALRDGMPEALQAAGYGTTYAGGGLVADTGSQLNATVLRGQEWLRQQAGKPYIWGGAGPEGYDCSGLVAALTNVLRGESNPFFRLGVAENQPWPGFVPGLSSAFASGFNSHHTAGTLSGMNLEARDFGVPVLVGGAAAGADNAQFTGQASLPVVGGRFIPGGGGTAFDPAAVVNPAFDATYRMIGEITTRFAGTMASMGQGEATKAADAVKAFALNKIAAVAGPGAAIGGDAKSAQDYARTQLSRFGWGPEQMNPLITLWNKESGWNARALNASSGATGIPQALPGNKMASAGADWLTNPATQINWGLGYVKDRYGSPADALSWHLGHNWYDNGGIVPRGTTVVHNETPGPEALLTGQQWTDIHALANQRAVDGPHITVQARTDASPEHIAAVTSRSVQQAMRTG